MKVTVRHKGGTEKQVELLRFELHEYIAIVDWGLAGGYEVHLATGDLWTFWNGSESPSRKLDWKVSEEDLRKLCDAYREECRVAEQKEGA